MLPGPRRRLVRTADLAYLHPLMGTEATNTCTVCGRANRTDALFCDRCTYPLRVANLADLTSDDKRLCLSYLFRELSFAVAGPVIGAVDEDAWIAYLNAFWLRPETAIIEYREAMAILGIQ